MVRSLFFALCIAGSAAVSAQTFTVENIHVDGLQRVSLGNVLSALAIREGQIVDDQRASDWLRAVYRTGYFYDVMVERQGNDIVIHVVERPAIESIGFDGNSTVPDETLESVFKDVGLEKGEIYSESILENIQLELEKQYGLQGRYNAAVTADITPLSRNRVNVDLQITEGPVARISHLNLVGNRVFTDEELGSTFYSRAVDPDKFWRQIGRRTHYASATLQGDEQRLEDFYFDRGYLDYALESRQVSISENKEDVAVTLNIHEGEQYRIRDIQLTGELNGLDQEIKQLINIESGEIYSRQSMTRITSSIRELLGDYGYAFAQVRDFQQPDSDSLMVDVGIRVEPGKPVYMNRIVIQGNSATNDEVIRRELRQLERALVINSKIQTSKARLERLGYFSSVDIRKRAIPGRDDMIDLVVTVEEAKDSQVNVQGGYAQGSGFFAEASLTQSNFLGKGVDFSASFTFDKSTKEYQLSLENPYFTIDGVSLGADVFYRRSDYSKKAFSTYATNSYGGRVTIGYPLSENQRVSYGIGASRDELFLAGDATLEMTDFVEDYGDGYTNTTVKFGWLYNTLNGTLKADQGSRLALNTEVGTVPGDLQYYRSTLDAQTYFHIADNFAFRLHSELGYGDSYGKGNLYPFYKNFHSGGSGSVRGFTMRSLGPTGTLEVKDENGNIIGIEASEDTIGGNIQVEYGAELIVPTPFVKNQNSFRTSLFLDAGNSFTDQCRSDNPSCTNGIRLDDIRYSVGADFTWISPLAPLSFSYGIPLNARDSDSVTRFAFNIGVSY
ncbi:MAG: outer membrane protein assembly factor BamA [Reinekea sp.]